MTIARAIEILTALLASLARKKAPELYDSVTLSIKALERIQTLRPYSKLTNNPFLPGETPEMDDISPVASHASKA